MICGDQVNGACQTADFVWLSLKGLVQAEAVPAGLSAAVHPVPADYVSKAILTVSREPGPPAGRSTCPTGAAWTSVSSSATSGRPGTAWTSSTGTPGRRGWAPTPTTP
ncbi:hypothetical protein ACFQ3Z_43515 [Streptomyces nogalater]